ncbi:hydantoinase/oxoprolinase family protein [Pigmentiphaga soli]|uniref:Hydantoinase/oxoprolinase family protein n=1 Tax=Pigmentiphaga soli TaxID=1007095 RepID=A0ABP8GKD2_9BURK
MQSEKTCRMGVDIGGTFTDIVLIEDDGTLYSKKVLSTPHDYSEAIQQGVTTLLAEINRSPAAVREFAHATTVATNTIIERKGVRCALVTTKGFRDVLELGRYRTPRLYDITFRKPEPLVERRFRFELDERIGGDGSIVKPIDMQELEALAAEIEKLDIQAVAITLLNSYVNATHECAVAEFLTKRLPHLSVSASTQLLPQLGEYERTSTTVVNAYIRPIVERYVSSLQRRLDDIGVRAPLGIMQSSGGMAPGRVVAERPIYIIESGPAAGVLGGQRVCTHAGLGNTIVFDMGGTTAKATIIIDGQFSLCPETEVGGGAALGQRMIKGGGFAVQVPTIDISEVGAGGGSIAAVDAAGGIQVGPRSAGAAPGPICYNRGGEQPTVTDANLLLGYLNPDALVGGELSLAYDKAKQALDALARQLGVSCEEGAYGIHLIANSTMLRALHGVSSEKGMDPSSFGLFAIGGNGPVHACTLAETSGMNTVIVPPVAGLFSALGLLFADVEHQLVQAFYRRTDKATVAELTAALEPLIEEGVALLAAEGYGDENRHIQLLADVKYAGQTAPLPVELPALPLPADTLDQLRTRFEHEHRRTFGYVTQGEPLQMIALRVVCRGVLDTPRMPPSLTRGRNAEKARIARKAYFGQPHGWLDTAVVDRQALPTDDRMMGPLIIEEYDTTTVVRPGWSASRDGANNIVIKRVHA